jgi:sugar/nucleoside kinase (ribokinase family)
MAKQPKVDLVGVGLNATDTVIHVSSFPECGSKVEYEAETIMLGGQVASTVIACQTWGLRTRYVGKLGDDDASRLHAQEFLRKGTEAHLVHVPGTPSARSLILLDRTGERTVLCRRDERLTLHPEELKREWIVNARALHVDGHDTGAATLAARWAREAGVLVTADLDDTYEGIDELLKNIDFLIVNHDFPFRVTGEHDLKTALREMQRRFGSRLAAATLGHDGVLAWDGEQFHYAAAFRVPVVDTTGAGDIFRAGFIYALLQDWTLPRCLDFSCAAAAINCMAEGARGGIRTVDQIESFMLTTPRYENAEALASLTAESPAPPPSGSRQHPRLSVQDHPSASS